MNKKKNSPVNALVVITSAKLAKRALLLFSRNGSPVQYEWNARGTAPNEMIDVLGLGSPEKNILVSILSKDESDDMLKKCKKILRLASTNSGIAFTVPLTGASNHLVQLINKQEAEKTEKEGGDKKMTDAKFSLVAAIINQGYSDEVMDVAREAGAGGGTVVPSRCIAAEDARSRWGFNLQDERDIIFIVTENTKKLSIMQTIGDKFGMHSEAKGIVVSLPVADVIGIEADE